VALGFLAAAGLGPSAWSLPIELKEKEFTIVLPEGFEESQPQTNENADIIRLFTRREAAAETPETWLTIRRLETHTPAPLLGPASQADSGETVRRYTERLNQADIEVLSARVTTNASSLAESAALLPLGPNTIQVDLKSRTLKDKEMDEIMRQVLASARPASAPEESGVPKWGMAILSLVLGFVVLLVALGKSKG